MKSGAGGHNQTSPHGLIAPVRGSCGLTGHQRNAHLGKLVMITSGGSYHMIPVRNRPLGGGPAASFSAPRQRRPVPRRGDSAATVLRRPPSLLLHPGLPYRARGAPCHTSVIIIWELLTGELWWIHLGPPCSGALKGYGQGS